MASLTGLAAHAAKRSSLSHEAGDETIWTVASGDSIVSTPAQLTAESERAALSPIHRSTSRTSSAPTVAPTSIPSTTMNSAAPMVSPAPAAVAKPADPVVVQQVPQQAVSVAPVAASEATPVVSTTPAVPATKQTHPARHRISKPRVEQESVAEPTTSPRAVTPSAPAARTRSNEVQMF